MPASSTTSANFLLGLLGILSFPSRRRRFGTTSFTITFGIGLEFLQGLVPGRMLSAWAGADKVLGVITAWTVSSLQKMN